MDQLTIGGPAEVDAKLARIRGYLAESGLGAILLTRQDNFAWLTGGRDNHVAAGSDVGVASLLVTPTDRVVVTNQIEAGRLRDEEIGDQGWEWRTYDWFRPSGFVAAVRDVAGDRPIGSDTPFPGAGPLDGAFDRLRADLLSAEVERYRAVGREMTAAIEETCQHVHAGQTELEIAADLSRRVRAHGGQPGVILIAADERINKYRHPIPTDRKLRDYVMLVLGGSMWGLTISISRFVAFHPLAPELRQKWRDVSTVAAYFTIATRPGREWSEIFRGATELYGRLGWPDEWRLHHQGGPTGYRGRDFTAGFESSGVVAATQAAAWNPSIAGTKSEDTIIVTASGHEFLTRQTGWPTIKIEYDGAAFEFSDVLIRQQVVRRYA